MRQCWPRRAKDPPATIRCLVAQGWLQTCWRPGGSSRHTRPTLRPVPVACRNEPFAKEDMKNPLTEESSFAVLFPAYREKYLREAWPQVTSLLKEHNLSCQVPLVPALGLGTCTLPLEEHSLLSFRCLLGLGLGYLGRRRWSTASAARCLSSLPSEAVSPTLAPLALTPALAPSPHASPLPSPHPSPHASPHPAPYPARPDRGLHDREHHAQDMGPVLDHQGARPHQAARPLRPSPAGAEGRRTLDENGQPSPSP